MFFPILIGGAVAVDAFAAGVWIGHRWGMSKNSGNIEAAVQAALDRATTLPSGGVTEMVHEVATGVSSVATDVSQVTQAATDATNKMQALIAAAKAGVK